MTGDESPQEAYERGTVAGKIDARLAGHDKHFATINGSLADVAKELHDLKLAVQRLGDQAVSRDATVVTTAAALKDAEDARRSKTESAWSPVAKAIAIGGVALVAIGTVLTVLLR
ncbi:hypothetical protein ACFPJ1_40755 [Kribbella qitaiheensis]|uniref:hypothetical protein n=1 Tax=Kribbella qitaiheensis TaxID=1544730 RepID=UPI00361CA419